VFENEDPALGQQTIKGGTGMKPSSGAGTDANLPGS
jgi:hypothetical protein